MRYVITAPIYGDLCKKIDKFIEEHKKPNDKGKSLPNHCTILATQLDDTKESEIISALEWIATTKVPFIIQCTTLDWYANSSLVVKVQKTKKLDQLHKSVWRGMKPYLKKDELVIPSRHESNRERVETLKTCGSSYAGKFYSPHITTFHPDIMGEFSIGYHSFENHFKGDSYALNEINLWKKQDSWEELKKFKLK